jgi:hypothetical protein
VPLAYWKVCVAGAARGRFAVAAFLVSQAGFMERELPVPEGASLGDDGSSESRSGAALYRVPLKYLEHVAQLRFPDSLRRASPW